MAVAPSIPPGPGSKEGDARAGCGRSPSFVQYLKKVPCPTNRQLPTPRMHHESGSAARNSPTEWRWRMTRFSATAEDYATDRVASYYEKFARGIGLIITEGLYIGTQHSQGYLYQPGMPPKAIRRVEGRRACRTQVRRPHLCLADACRGPKPRQNRRGYHHRSVRQSFIQAAYTPRQQASTASKSREPTATSLINSSPATSTPAPTTAAAHMKSRLGWRAKSAATSWRPSDPIWRQESGFPKPKSATRHTAGQAIFRIGDYRQRRPRTSGCRRRDGPGRKSRSRRPGKAALVNPDWLHAYGATAQWSQKCTPACSRPSLTSRIGNSSGKNLLSNRPNNMHPKNRAMEADIPQSHRSATSRYGLPPSLD